MYALKESNTSFVVYETAEVVTEVCNALVYKTIRVSNDSTGQHYN